MKTILFTLFFGVFINCYAIAQIHSTSVSIINSVGQDKTWSFDKKGVSNDGLTYLNFNCNTDQAVSKTFYFKNDTCVMVRFILPNSRFTETVKVFSDKYLDTGNLTFLDVKNDLAYIIKMYDNEPIFDVLLMAKNK